MAKKEQNDSVITREHVCMTADDHCRGLSPTDKTSKPNRLNETQGNSFRRPSPGHDRSTGAYRFPL